MNTATLQQEHPDTLPQKTENFFKILLIFLSVCRMSGTTHSARLVQNIFGAMTDMTIMSVIM
jgi:hypothetical protein